jgi:cob(I)alamin adenosyltransferase
MSAAAEPRDKVEPRHRVWIAAVNATDRYLNRLSSFLFALARYEEYLAGRQTTLAKEVGSKE